MLLTATGFLKSLARLKSVISVISVRELKFTPNLLSIYFLIIHPPEPPKAQIREICEICERIKIYSNLLPIYFQHLLSHRVHEVALGAGEDEDGEEEGDAHEDGAVEETTPVEGATT